jgi:lipooligosaccharide transport system ATP-binding protein
MSAVVGEAAVEATALYKRYGELEAVAGVDFRIERGEYFGFLGPNGAGKTSTLRMVQAVSAPSAGRLRVLGLDPVRDGKRVRARLGVCGQDDTLDPDLRVMDNLRVYGRYFPQDRRTTAERAEQLIEFLQLAEKRDKKIQELSGGMKRRLMVARALINEPELLVLDEPTTGLDPQARHLIWQKLRELRSRGVTLVLTTHYMDEAERLCDRLMIMDRGKILAAGAPRALIERHVGREVVELDCGDADAAAILRGLELSDIPGERRGDVRTWFFRERDARVEQLVERARAHGVRCLVRNATLEDVFLKLTGRELQE